MNEKNFFAMLCVSQHFFYCHFSFLLDISHLLGALKSDNLLLFLRPSEMHTILHLALSNLEDSFLRGAQWWCESGRVPEIPE